MIVKAAVKIYDKRQCKEFVIPCHRHCDAFYILHEFGYQQSTDYMQIAQGFLDEHNQFYNRVDALQHAKDCKQIETAEYNELFSEDLW